MSSSSMQHCAWSGKIGYSRAEAGQVAGALRAKKGPRGAKKGMFPAKARAYRCSECGMWHVTSKTRNM